MTSVNKHQHIHDMIDSFLENRSTSEGGGWAKVDETDIKTLNSIFRKLIDAKYQSDADGDKPVDVEFFDRTKYERQFFLPLPHARRDGFDLSVCLQRLQRTGSNLESAHSAHQRELRALSDFETRNLRTGSAFGFGEFAYEQLLDTDRGQFAKEVYENFIAFIRQHKTDEELSRAAESSTECEKISAFINQNFSSQFKSPVHIVFAKHFSTKPDASCYRFTIFFNGLNNVKPPVVLQRLLW